MRLPKQLTTLRTAGIITLMLMCGGCSKPHEGEFVLQDSDVFGKQTLKIEGDQAWVITPSSKIEYRAILKGDTLRIESLDGILLNNYRIANTGLVGVDRDEFYRKQP